jgi:hypothetical protein
VNSKSTKNQPVSIRPFDYVKNLVGWISLGTGFAGATSKFWLERDKISNFYVVSDYLVNRFLPELLFLFLVGIALVIPMRAYRRAFQWFRFFYRLERRELRFLTRRRISRIFPLVLVTSGLVVSMYVLARPLTAISAIRYRFVSNWTVDDFYAYQIVKIKKDLSALQFSKATTRLKMLNGSGGESSLLREASKALADTETIGRFGKKLSNIAYELESKQGLNRRSLALYSHAFFLSPEDQSVAQKLVEYDQFSARIRLTENAISEACDHNSQISVVNFERDLITAVDSLKLKDEIQELFAVQSGVSAVKLNSDFICNYSLRLGRIFNASLSTVGILKMHVDAREKLRVNVFENDAIVEKTE